MSNSDEGCVLIHVSNEEQQENYIVPLKDLRFYTTGLIPDILETMRRQNGWHANHTIGSQTDAFEFDYISFLLGIYCGDTSEFLENHPDLDQDKVDKIKPEYQSILRRYMPKTVFNVPQSVRYFLSRDDHFGL